ncbi:hypothetical protein FT663_01191 [Candidozyma haemuli var. vulneris]|uniref:Zn(2)-C6 fungal-type domain-containing protein n=1 Tax=Candidozyma haemuli TaxID=45357 RepID=A0A2V1AXB2_9ASCO|nr:hypothetical protein CXQ85_005399 [[Candida] haemuloni]KAF3992354.1 hypothetical protein FT662_01226 [[Candida] haemuloni var. vulneris]KAF3994724.1 hypothetical protein FT663_01191 [[Candida] haemuloni var. vulneris]PVH22717.1 hypothetical protein CXQ85_005399 [[Candida] haemuloni]
MDYYYRRSMGNGAVTSKFRIAPQGDDKPRVSSPKIVPLENGATHHPSNCTRCYRLKKKCSRTYPKCLYCLKAGSECEYVDRRGKKACLWKPDDDSTVPASVPVSPVSHPKSVSIASLVHSEETEQPFQNIDLPPTKKSASKSAVAKKINNRAIARHATSAPPNLSDEFLVVKPIADQSLPSAFTRAYFASYSWRYPVVNKSKFEESFISISFATETLVSLEVYLVMAVGCIVYDCNNGTSHYNRIFSDKLIESIIDIITYDPEIDTQSATLLVLLCIYAVNASNIDLAWSILGYLNRSIIYKTDFVGTSRTGFSNNIFWAVHNLDRELSLMLNKPSQFVPVAIIKQNADFSYLESDANLAALMTKAVELHKLQDRVLSLKLGLQENTKDTLRQLSSDLESWRVSVSSVVHNEYSESPLLTRVIGVVHLDYYYLLIEIDQLSSTESFQFTLQFLSNSFSLLLNESSNKDVSGISLYSFFWFSKFFKVIDYNLSSLLKTLKNENLPRSDVNHRIGDFNGNLQLIVNLLKYLLNSSQSPAQYKGKMTSWVTRLTLLNIKLMGSNILSVDDEQYKALVANVDGILNDE